MSRRPSPSLCKNGHCRTNAPSPRHQVTAALSRKRLGARDTNGLGFHGCAAPPRNGRLLFCNGFPFPETVLIGTHASFRRFAHVQGRAPRGAQLLIKDTWDVPDMAPEVGPGAASSLVV